MSTLPRATDPIDAVALLAEPNRRDLYALVAAGDDPVGRDDAVAALGISRELAAFHLDRLVEAGLLETEYRRRGGRTGPGAGRPAKLYRRARQALQISLPPRRYDLAAEVMATALDRVGGVPGTEAVATIARERGTAVGLDARRHAGKRPGRRRLLAGLLDILRGAGYEPRTEPDGRVCLQNCPYDALVVDHRDLTCGMNLAWAEGVVGGLGDAKVSAELAPEPGRCCVVFHAGTERPGTRQAHDSRDVTR